MLAKRFIIFFCAFAFLLIGLSSRDWLKYGHVRMEYFSEMLLVVILLSAAISYSVSPAAFSESAAYEASIKAARPAVRQTRIAAGIGIVLVALIGFGISFSSGNRTWALYIVPAAIGMILLWYMRVLRWDASGKNAARIMTSSVSSSVWRGALAGLVVSLALIFYLVLFFFYLIHKN